MKTSDFDFELPEHLIAQHPLERRDDSRMLVVHRAEGRWEHRMFRDLPEYVGREDLLVLNNTKVIPARYRERDGSAEILRLEPYANGAWRCMVKPGRRFKIGRELAFGQGVARVEDILEDGTRVLRFDPELREEDGLLALPPYMHREQDLEDQNRYQTVFADQKGAIAAPTAGLHFTEEMLASFRRAFVTLHVGAGTFLPVKVDQPEDHVMHSEIYDLTPDTVDEIGQEGDVWAVGTTVVRVLEHCARQEGGLAAGQGATEIFIYPPYSFQVVDHLLTNFHLPCSTLMMLVSAFAGRELILECYAEAVREEYRFFSYGDCMLLI